MSDDWINSSMPNSRTTRIQDAVGNNSQLLNDIDIKGYKRILSESSPDGTVIYREIDANGNVLSIINL